LPHLFGDSVAFALRAHRRDHQPLARLGALSSMSERRPCRRLLRRVIPNGLGRMMPCDQLFDGDGEV
jgi:hypothetical protein